MNYHLIVTLSSTRQSIELEVDEETLVDDAVQLSAIEMNVPITGDGCFLVRSGTRLPAGHTLAQLGVRSGDQLVLQIATTVPVIESSSRTESRRPQQSEAGSPWSLSTPAFDPDALDPDTQRRIEDQIRLSNIQTNFEAALEHNAEAFASVFMLYVECRVTAHSGRNAQVLQAFVDSGAQVTIMSASCAERCGILRLMDSRIQGVARGVGEARILGRVHLALLELGGEYMECSFTIVENNSLELLLGLDMMRKHAMCIDLERNCLRVRGRQIPFLAEHQVVRSVLDEASRPTTSEPSEKVRRLVELGFDRETVERALEMAKGNEDLAAGILFQE